MEHQGKQNTFLYTKTFPLEKGNSLPCLQIAYHTYGKLNAKRDNCIWVCHGLTANSDVADWWPHTVVKDGFLDPDKYFIVCANMIGSCYGSTGPMSENPETGEPWFDKFPKLTIRDMVNANRILADHLGLSTIYSIIGSSLGGFQAMEWGIVEPQRFKSMVLIATAPYASPWAIAIDETQRMSIMADKTFGEKSSHAGREGLAAARAIALLSYRGAKGYNLTQQDLPSADNAVPDYHRACSYQRHQGDKLVKRFDAYSYMTILDAFDTHNIGRGRNGIQEALKHLSMPVLTVGITSDIIFSPEEIKAFTAWIPDALYREISSQFGHDGFLVEHSLLNTIIRDFFKSLSFQPALPGEESENSEDKTQHKKLRRNRKSVDLEDPHPQPPSFPVPPIP